MEAVPVLREAIGYREQVEDFVTRELFEDILSSEEEHIDWLETQLQLIEKSALSITSNRKCDCRDLQAAQRWLPPAFAVAG